MSARVWVTRTQPEADATAARVRALGFEPVVAPVLEARALAQTAIDVAGAEALVFTSGHAVRAFAELSTARDLPVFAVGDRTAGVARASGFARVRSAAGDVGALADQIAAAAPSQVLHLRASETAGDLEGLLAARGVRTRGVLVYETIATPLPAAPTAIRAVLIHSPKAARRVAALVNSAAARDLVVLAISPTAASPLEGLGFAQLRPAPFPNEASLLDLLKELLKP